MNRHIKCLDSIPGKQNIDKSSYGGSSDKTCLWLETIEENKCSEKFTSKPTGQFFFATNVSSVLNELVG